MEILDTRTLRGPNYWSINHKVIVAKIDIGEFEELPSNRIDGFTSRLQQILPGLYEHHCSEGKPGGFLERLRTGTWMGHIVEHIALEIQTMAGMPCFFGKTRGTWIKGIYHVVISYEEERAGLYALNAAVKMVETVAHGGHYQVDTDVEELKKIAAKDKLGPSTKAIVNAAIAMGIPYIRMGGSLVQLGYGNKLKRIEATITEQTSSIAVDLASDKEKTKQILNEASLPVPYGTLIYDRHELDRAIDDIGFPLVIKPFDGNQGKGVAVDIRNYEEAVSSFNYAKSFSDAIIIEEFIQGYDYRLLVINYKLRAAARRTPAMVIGNSYSTVRELVDLMNQSADRGYDHENILTKIVVDKLAEEMLKKQRITQDSVPLLGQRVLLRQTANLSQGGTAEDVTRLVHPDIVEIAERAARVIGLDICGIDLVADDISMPLNRSKPVIIEVNAAPGFRMHTNPAAGAPQPVGEAVIKMLFPGNSDGRIPVIAVTGTNGKTTTTRLIAHIASTAGYHVGYTTTEGIYINNTLIEKGDCTGYLSAQKVLKDRSVNFAVLECARGGILKQGLGFDLCNTGVVTNVAEDHLGLNGIETIDDMAAVKSVVAESVRNDGLAILNEDNDYTYRMMDRLKCSVALFSINSRSKRLIDHCKKGGIAAFYKDRKIILMNGNKVLLSEDIDHIPLTHGGKAPFMIENVLAAIIASYFNQIDITQILAGIRTFSSSFEKMPGRLNHIKFRNFDLILDYAHNMHGIQALGSYIKQINASKKTGIISAPGDRRESDIIGIGRVSAELFDRIIIRIDKDTRDRKPSEIADLLRTGINLSAKKRTVEIVEKETDAIMHACSVASKNSLIVLLSEDITGAYEFINGLKNKEDHSHSAQVFAPETPYVLRLGKDNIYEYTNRKVNSQRR